MVACIGKPAPSEPALWEAKSASGTSRSSDHEALATLDPKLARRSICLHSKSVAYYGDHFDANVTKPLSNFD
jgi:hypothetical protein